MNPKFLLKNWSSVSAAASMLLGLNPADASTTDLPQINEAKRGDGDPFQPLILKAAPTQVIAEQLFAGHRSHSSHSSHASASSGGGAGHQSHASHYSSTTGGSYYTPPVPVAPRPSVPVVPTTRTTPVYPSSYAATPVPQQLAPYVPPVTQAPTRIELTNGAALYGTVLVKSAAGITFKGLDQKNYKIPRILLTASTIASLALPAEQASTATSTTTASTR